MSQQRVSRQQQPNLIADLLEARAMPEASERTRYSLRPSLGPLALPVPVASVRAASWVKARHTSHLRPATVTLPPASELLQRNKLS